MNAAFLAAVAVHESGKGTSRIALRKTTCSDGVLWTEILTLVPVPSQPPESGISFVAYRLRTVYFDQLGLTTLRAVGSRYATDPEWADKVLYWVKRLQEEGER